MNFRLAIWLVTFIVASQAAARVVEVRSGEHDTFSRIVLPIPVGTKWALKQTSNIAELYVELPDIQYDTSQVFRRIPRNRLLELSQHQPEKILRMKIGCECKVIAFTQSGALLVVDIQDAEIPNSQVPSNAKETSGFKFRTVASGNMTGPVLAWNLQSEISDDPIEATQQYIADKLPVISLTEQNIQQSANVSGLRLISQIERAAAQGLLTPNIRIVGVQDTNNASNFNSINSETIMGKIVSPIQISVTSITGRGSNVASNDVLSHPSAHQSFCTPPNLVAIPDWGNDQPFGTQIGNRRMNLFGEFDNVRQQGVMELTQNLLYFGFGTEAQKALELFKGDGQTRRVFNALAEILDYGHTVSDNPFFEEQDCNSDVALWAFLAETETLRSDTLNTKAILTAFMRLPNHLKVLVGPDLARKFSDTQNFQSADIVLRMANRTLERSDPALDLVKANSELEHKGSVTAPQQLLAIAQSGTEKSPQALIDFVEAQNNTNKAIPPDIPDLIGAYFSEFRNSEISPNLRRAHILSLALTGRFTEAFQTYFEKDDHVNETTLPHVMRLLAERADDITFLRFALAPIEIAGQGFSVDLQNSIAARLIKLGFLVSAANLLNESNVDTADDDRRIMKAQIAISENMPHRALAALMGVSHPKAKNLRTEALLKIGDFSNAGILLETNGVDSGRAFWLAENWDAVLRDDDSQFLEAAILAKTLTSTVAETTVLGPLASAHALADNSLAIRSNISDLLGLLGAAP